MVRTSLDGFWITDLRGHFLEVNDAYCQLIGYSREELMQMSISDLEAIERPEETTSHITKILEKGSDCFDTSSPPEHSFRQSQIVSKPTQKPVLHMAFRGFLRPSVLKQPH